MKEIFLKSVSADKGMFFEIENDSMNISLWKKANSTTVSLDSESVLNLGKFIQENFSITKELTNEERFEVNQKWEKHIVSMLDSPKTNQESQKDKSDE
tara:strand:+ start:292 stop:585 length:294 start_codon:yes stop_codon:yes gene_type:complete